MCTDVPGNCGDCVKHGMPALPSGRDAVSKAQGGGGGLDGGCGMVAPLLLATGQKWEGTVWCMAPCFSMKECLSFGAARMRTVPG